jgi:hypothetical protein
LFEPEETPDAFAGRQCKGRAKRAGHVRYWGIVVLMETRREKQGFRGTDWHIEQAKVTQEE